MDNTLFPGIDLCPENMTREELIDLFNRLKALAAKYKSSEEALRLDEARLEALLSLKNPVLNQDNDRNDIYGRRLFAIDIFDSSMPDLR